jgi:hypothetical protein
MSQLHLPLTAARVNTNCSNLYLFTIVCLHKKQQNVDTIVTEHSSAAAAHSLFNKIKCFKMEKVVSGGNIFYASMLNQLNAEMLVK